MMEVLFVKDWLKKKNNGVIIWGKNTLLVFPKALNIAPISLSEAIKSVKK